MSKRPTPGRSRHNITRGRLCALCWPRYCQFCPLLDRTVRSFAREAETARKSPTERLVNWTAATLSLPDPIVDDVLKQYLLQEHRPVIVTFLDLLKIPHLEGMIEQDFDLATLPNERVQEAARTLLASADRTGSELYLKYLVLQGGPWAGIEEIMPTGE